MWHELDGRIIELSENVIRRVTTQVNKYLLFSSAAGSPFVAIAEVFQCLV